MNGPAVGHPMDQATEVRTASYSVQGAPQP
jgi:hypothetical protein